MTIDIYVNSLRAEDVQATVGYGPQRLQCQVRLGESITLLTHSEHRSPGESARFLIELRAAITETIEYLRTLDPAPPTDVCPFCNGTAQVQATSLLVEDNQPAAAQVVRCVCSQERSA